MNLSFNSFESTHQNINQLPNIFLNLPNFPNFPKFPNFLILRCSHHPCSSPNPTNSSVKKKITKTKPKPSGKQAPNPLQSGLTDGEHQGLESDLGFRGGSDDQQLEANQALVDNQFGM